MQRVLHVGVTYIALDVIHAANTPMEMNVHSS
jgi:hypothetical protein